MISWSETLRTALEAIKAHRLRSALTALGILIGIASVVLTVGLGLGAQAKVQDQISALGSNLLIVSPGSSTDSDGARGGFGTGSTLTTSDADAISTSASTPDVQAVVPVASSSISVSSDGTNWTTQVVGTTSNWVDVRSRSLQSGRFFNEDENARSANVAVIGSETAEELFGRESAVGKTLSVSGNDVTVIGVLETTGASGTDASENDLVVVPLSTYFRSTSSSGTSLSNVYVQATSLEALPAAFQEVQNLLNVRHGVSTSDQDFSIATQSSLIETANETNRTMTVLLAGISAISLLVGGVGVMNIMLVSVSERVREIGLRKALGATPRAIQRQFLVEAATLGLLGGVIGVFIGVVTALILPIFIDQPVLISPLAVLFALLVSLGLGIGFGVYPARRAAQMMPIDALRSD